MAATISNITATTGTSSSGSISLTGVTASVGDMLVVAVAVDNSGASGVSPVSGISDAAGNTWVSRGAVLKTGGSANDGTALHVWTCAVTSALSSSQITVTFSPNAAARVVTGYRVQPGASETVSFVSAATGATGTSTTPSSGAVSVTSGHTVFGFAAAEVSDLITDDSDTTNGTWSSQRSSVADVGSNTTSQRLVTQHKTVNATGDQTYNVSISSSRDWAVQTVVLSSSVSTTSQLAATEDADTAAMEIATAWQIALAATESADTVAFVANTGWTAALAAVEDADTAAFDANTGWLLDLAATEDADTAAFTALLNSVALAVTEDADTAAFALVALASGEVSLAAAEAADTAAFEVDVEGDGDVVNGGGGVLYDARARKRKLETAINYHRAAPSKRRELPTLTYQTIEMNASEAPDMMAGGVSVAWPPPDEDEEAMIKEYLEMLGYELID